MRIQKTRNPRQPLPHMLRIATEAVQDAPACPPLSSARDKQRTKEDGLMAEFGFSRDLARDIIERGDA